jgi:hypothetical protein
MGSKFYSANAFVGAAMLAYQNHTRWKTNLDYLSLERSIRLLIAGEKSAPNVPAHSSISTTAAREALCPEYAPAAPVRRRIPPRNARSAKFCPGCSSAKPSASAPRCLRERARQIFAVRRGDLGVMGRERRLHRFKPKRTARCASAVALLHRSSLASAATRVSSRPRRGANDSGSERTAARLRIRDRAGA